MAMDFSGVKRCVEPSMCILEGHAILIDLARLRQGKNLKAARVGQHGTRPTHKFVQAAQVAYEFVARAQVQMIGVAQHQRGVELFEVLRCKRLDGRLGADRREDWSAHIAVGGGENACAGAVGFGCDRELEHRAHYNLQKDGYTLEPQNLAGITNRN